MTALDRRDVLRVLALAGLAVGATTVLDACGRDVADPGSAPRTTTDLELVVSDVKRRPGSAADLPSAVANLHALGSGVYGELATGPGNLALSPYSIGVALALTLNGAKGETLQQMLGVLDADDVAALNRGLNALTSHVEALAGRQQRADGTTAEIALDAANALFGERTTTWEQEFLDTLAREYGAGLQTVDYLTAADAATVAINAWIAERTRDKITDLVPPGELDNLTRLVLVNTLYLKAPWERPFEPALTEDGPFALDDGSTVTVPMMRSADQGPVVLGAGDGWAATQLPYAGGTLAMTVVLPDAGRLVDVEADLVAGGLPDVLDSLEPELVELTLPKWTFRTKAPLKDVLTSIGMELPFVEGAADFSGMTVEDRLYIKAVLHEVFIAVDEEGTEAAAATAVVMRETSAGPALVPFVVDRPFLFVIHDVEHGTPLFVGRVVDPRG